MLNGDIDVLELTGDITNVLSLEGNLLPIGPKGDKGDPGFSPVVTTSKSGKTTTVKFETATGNVYAYIQDGEDGQGSGDMLTDVYDQNKNGIVDNAEKVNNHTVLTDVPTDAVFTDTVYDDTEVRGLINAKPDFSDIPTKVSDLTNDSGFIDNTVNNLTNYYLKTETYTKAEINSLIAQIPGFNVEVVQTLPVSDIDPHTIYLVSKTGSTGDIYDEYLYINNSWELIGSTAVDLTDYVKFTNYATNSKGGVIKTDTSAYGTAMYSGYLTGSTKTYAQYGSSANALFVSKGTLENVITGKELVNKDVNDLTNYANVNESAQTSEEDVSSATFENTLEAPMNIDLKGNTLQNGTPTPNSPIPINNVSGDNDIVVCGKNLFDKDTMILNAFINQSNLQLASSNDFRTIYIPCKPNTIYTIQKIQSNRFVWGFTSDDNLTIPKILSGVGGDNTETQKTITSTNDAKYMFVMVSKITDDTTNINDLLNSIQIEEGSTATTYEAYNGTTYNIDLIGKNKFNKNNIEAGYLSNAGNVISNANFSTSNFINVKGVSKITISGSSGSNENVCFYTNTKTFISYVATGTNTTMTIDVPNNAYYLRATIKNTNLDAYQIEYGSETTTYEDYASIELNKIGTYQDYIYKENGKWYLHKEIGKYTFTGNENFTWDSDKQRIIIPISNLGINTPPLTTSQPFNVYNQKVIGTTFDNLYNKVVDNCIALSTGNSISIRSTSFDNLNTGKSTIANTDLYYILATPTNTEITYTPLIEQLESIKNAMSKQGTTNVNQVNNDAPFMLDLSVFNDTYNGRYEELKEQVDNNTNDINTLNNYVYSKDIITAGFSSDYVLATTSAYVDVPLNTIYSKIGTNFEINNNGEIICKKEGYVKVSCHCNYLYIAGTGSKWITISLYHTYYNSFITLNITGTQNERADVSGTDRLVYVYAGDKLKMQTYGTQNDTLRAAYSYITCEYV